MRRGEGLNNNIYDYIKGDNNRYDIKYSIGKTFFIFNILFEIRGIGKVYDNYGYESDSEIFDAQNISTMITNLKIEIITIKVI
ncbi:hypothetical protein U3516DRAFT_744432 [Neocallimastix sp. 'constans']